VRTLRPDDGCVYLGPFRSRRHAELVLTAIWDAVPIRRCLTRGGERSSACNFAQLGVSICPCDGSVSEAAYAEVVDRLRDGIERAPDLLLDPLAERMRHHAREQRFEEAAALRDRYRALATALERRRRWNALERAGAVSAEDGCGDGVFIDTGRMAAAWRRPDPTPLFRLDGVPGPATQVAPTVALAEEAHLVWRWLDREGVRIIDATGNLSMPATRIPDLEAAG
jgi:DNA polymerase-3 subunit epsilon